MVGMETRKLNSSDAGRDMPTSCPAAMVDMERDVPGNTAESTWQSPIQTACHKDICSTWLVAGSPRELHTSMTHIRMPPISSESAITFRLSRCFPMDFVSRKEGIAVQKKAISVSVSG